MAAFHAGIGRRSERRRESAAPGGREVQRL